MSQPRTLGWAAVLVLAVSGVLWLAVSDASFGAPAAPTTSAPPRDAQTGKQAAAGADAIAALLLSVPERLMPPGVMTDVEEQAFNDWATRALGGAAITAEFAVDSVAHSADGSMVLVGSLQHNVPVNGREARCQVRAVLDRGNEGVTIADLRPGAVVSLTGRLAAANPLTPTSGRVQKPGMNMGVRGWSAADAFFRLNIEKARAMTVEAAPPPPPPPVKPAEKPDKPAATPASTAKPAPKPVEAPAAPAPQVSKPPEKPAEFFGVAAAGAKIVYIVDRSGSMTDSIDYVKKALKKSIGELTEDKWFHVIFYSSGPPVEMPTRRLVEATERNKKLAFEFVDAVIAQGETDPSKALKRAFELKPDAIYLLTDGEFDKLVVGVVKGLNAGGKAKVHTIAFLYRTGEEVLKQIAADNGGEYKFVSEEDMRKMSESK